MMNRSMMELKEEVTEFKSGFTWRSLLALLYSVCVFTPALMWLQLTVVGAGLGIAISFTTLLLFTELARITGKPITKQEAAIIFGPAATAGSAGFLSLIYRIYFVRHPLLQLFGINSESVPTWWAPPPSSTVWDLRTLIHPDCMYPILVFVAYWFINLAGDIFFGLIGREIFIEVENLSFPIQQIAVDAISTVTERSETRLHVFSWCVQIGFIWGLLLYAIPTYMTVIGKPVSLIPIPWADLTWRIERYLPGAGFGIATDMMLVAAGIVLPPLMVMGMFIGSAARYLVINPFLIHMRLSEWASSEYGWNWGMGLIKIIQSSTLTFWLNPLIGVGFAVGLVPTIFHGREIYRSLTSIFQIRRKTTLEKRISGPPTPLWVFIFLFSLGCIGAVIADLMLVPGFPVWGLILYEMVFPLIVFLGSGRIVGLTGQEASFPYISRLVIIATGYQKLDAWFLPLYLNPGTSWLRAFKICQLTKTTSWSWIKATLIAYPVSLLAGFLYTNLFWSIAPIPSSLYPVPGIMWPISIQQHCFWITRTSFFDLSIILGSFAVFGALTAATQILRLPFSMISVAAGFGVPIPSMTTMLIGLIIGRIIAKIFGEHQFKTYKNTIGAGLSAGEGIAIVLGVAAAIAIKSIFSRPF